MLPLNRNPLENLRNRTCFRSRGKALSAKTIIESPFRAAIALASFPPVREVIEPFLGRSRLCRDIDGPPASVRAASRYVPLVRAGLPSRSRSDPAPSSPFPQLPDLGPLLLVSGRQRYYPLLVWRLLLDCRPSLCRHPCSLMRSVRLSVGCVRRLSGRQM
jgi:hypothetical protein